MRILALVFPRLGVQLARAANPALAGRPIGFLAGEGDGALLTAISVEATVDGVEPGMTALQARQRSPGIVLERDNARECLAHLDSVTSILRTRTTTDVAIVSRNTVALSLEGLEARFADEGAAAHGILALARSWSGLDVRAAVASSVEAAICHAGKARRFPVIAPAVTEEPSRLPAYEPVAVSARWDQPVAGSAATARLGKLLGTAEPLLETYRQSYRLVRVELECGPYRSEFRLRPDAPLHRSTEAASLIRERIDAAELAGVTAVRVTFDAPGPGVEVAPWRPPVATVHELAGPAVPVQRRLLRAS